uniref:Uncharacterized protein n=1 Tax=Molossus molossus TaxID=27622 RepID=A0A7J8F997_MOLMO|nr:hypothetical protein HJG59_008545 [Molossus molossus]
MRGAVHTGSCSSRNRQGVLLHGMLGVEVQLFNRNSRQAECRLLETALSTDPFPWFYACRVVTSLAGWEAFLWLRWPARWGRPGRGAEVGASACVRAVFESACARLSWTVSRVGGSCTVFTLLPFCFDLNTRLNILMLLHPD